MKTLLFLIVLIGAIMLIPSTKAYQFNLITKEIEGIAYTPECLSECHLPINFSLDNTISIVSGNLKTYLDLNMLNYQIKMLENHTYTYNISDCIEKSIIALNGSSTTVKVCQEIPKTYSKLEWVDLKLPLSILKNKWYAIDFIGYRKAKTGFDSFDAIPKIVVNLTQFSWWNSSWNASVPIYINNSNSETHTFENVTFWVNTTGSTTITSCVNEIRYVNATTSLEISEIDIIKDLAPNCLLRIKANSSANVQYPNDPFGYIYYNNSKATAPTRVPILHWTDDFDDGAIQTFWTLSSNCVEANGYMKLASNCLLETAVTGNSTWKTPETLHFKMNISTKDGDLGNLGILTPYTSPDADSAKNKSLVAGLGQGCTQFWCEAVRVNAGTNKFLPVPFGNNPITSFYDVVTIQNSTHQYINIWNTTHQVKQNSTSFSAGDWPSTALMFQYYSGTAPRWLDFVELYNGIVNFYINKSDAYVGGQTTAPPPPPPPIPSIAKNILDTIINTLIFTDVTAISEPTNQTCISNVTLFVQKNITFEYNGNLSVVTETYTQRCTFGCDTVNNSCKNDPFWVYMGVFAGIIAIVVLFYWIYRRL